MSEPDKREYIEPKDPLEHRCLGGELPLENIEFSLKEEIDAYMRGKGSKERNSRGWIYPSGIGKCDRQVVYNLREGTPGRETASPLDQKLGGIGHALHDKLQEWSAEAVGAEEFEAEKAVRYGLYKLSMRIDGVMAAKDWIIEYKTLGDSGYKNLRKPREDDILQVHCYMFVLDIPRTILYYFNRNTGEDCEFKVYFDHNIWEGILENIGRAMKHVKEGTTPPRIKNKFWCSKCRYNEYCMNDKS